ncbi:DUF481 domain-containing protein [Chondromyces apiculatus]|uniref:DUF481 domain-containing protein n=1 Tax=Chondromyces apiculatus DSM 436 TaxID=1192034 RepID=A0A017T4Q8_9BACT|nr:DUF481 domain-containing protein [Chondromyces apiculatus]EYF04214.1 Hypothetical protein CAP_4691 [Chondromyces apiculatus DSM 436]
MKARSFPPLRRLVGAVAGSVLGAVVALTSARAEAQIVNVQPLIGGDSEKKGLSLTFEGSADVRRGNTNLTSLSGSAVGQYRRGRHLVFMLVRGDFGAAADTTIVNKDLEHLRYRIDLPQPFSLEAFVQHDRDAFRRLALRALVGIGPRIHVIRWEKFEAALGTAYMLENEELAMGAFSDSGQGTLANRISSYVVLSTRLSDSLQASATIYLQPRIERVTDVRVLHESSLLAKATKLLSLKLTMTSAFDAEPPAGVAPLDTTMKGSLLATF